LELFRHFFGPVLDRHLRAIRWLPALRSHSCPVLGRPEVYRVRAHTHFTPHMLPSGPHVTAATRL
jgi:hypothetical protein